MVYFKVLLNDKRQKSNNIYPVVIRVTHNRQNTTIDTGIRVDQNQWDNKSSKVKSANSNAQQLNQSITDFYNKVQKVALKLADGQQFSFSNLKFQISDKPKITLPKSKPVTFSEFAEKLIAEMVSINKAGNSIVYKTAKNRFLAYANNDSILFNEIDYNLLEGFRLQLAKDNVKQNTISNYFRTIRAIYNKAIKQKIIERSSYPFLDIIVKTERTAKRAMSLIDLQKIYTSN